MDYFDFILPDDEPIPESKQELTHIGSLALQVMFPNLGPMADWFYGTILFLLDKPEYYRILVAEIRDKFNNAEEITPIALACLPYLHACMEESLRLLPSNNTGLPRLSPGNFVDGIYTPKGYVTLR
jgi:cytochrome P450